MLPAHMTAWMVCSLQHLMYSCSAQNKDQQDPEARPHKVQVQQVIAMHRRCPAAAAWQNPQLSQDATMAVVQHWGIRCSAHAHPAWPCQQGTTHAGLRTMDMISTPCRMVLLYGSASACMPCKPCPSCYYCSWQHPPDVFQACQSPMQAGAGPHKLLLADEGLGAAF